MGKAYLVPGDKKKIGENPRWGTRNRKLKAEGILLTMTHYVPQPLSETVWLDIGCGNGEVSATIAKKVKEVIAIDPEPWSLWKSLEESQSNLRIINQSAENLSLDNDSFDIVVCNQVYEHVSDPLLMISEIYRVLKPGGYCYFAGPNLLFPIEPHVFWPFVHWLPRSFAVKLLQRFGSKGVLDAYSKDYWTLKKWLGVFQFSDAVPYILKNPKIYGRQNIFWRIISVFPARLFGALSWISPGFIFVLKKE